MVEPHVEEDEKPEKGDLTTLADRKKKRKLEQLAEDQTRTKVDTYRSNTNR